MDEIEVTILIPVYNRAELLKHTLASVQRQTYPAWRAYICDDGSTEDVEAVVKSFGEHRFQYVRLMRGGIGATRNRALALAITPFVVMLDADDLWRPTFLEAAIGYLKDSPDVDLVHLGQGLIDGDGYYLGPRTRYVDIERMGYDSAGHVYRMDALDYFLTEPFGPNNLSSLVMRRALAQSVQVAEIDFMEDWDYLVKLSSSGGVVAHLPVELSLYRTYERPVNVSRQIASLRGALDMVRSHHFTADRHRRIQRQITGNLYELIGFDQLAIHQPAKALGCFIRAMRYRITRRCLYGCARATFPRATVAFKERLKPSE